jgi:DNA recombination protein RmuC
MVEEAAKSLESRIKGEAKSIFEKYLDPPNTTDVALLFLPVEGLFAEILRRPGLFEKLQNEYKVIITGPTTLTAILNSLHMGFRTLAIEKRTSEVWSLLGAVKTEFGKFGDVLDKTHEKLRQASESIDSAKTRTRAIERKLKDVQELPSGEETKLI